MSASDGSLWHRFAVANGEKTLVFEWRGVVKYLPLILCGGFFAFSALWLALGPLDWHISNLPLLYSFLGLCLLALIAGYTYGIRRRGSKGSSTRRVVVLNPNRILIATGFVALVLYFPTVYATTGAWFPDVWGGLTHAGDAYRNTKSLNLTSSPLILYVRFLLSPLLILAAPLTYFLWPRLSWLARIFGLSCVLGTVSLSIAQGINKGMADLTAYTCLFLVLVAASSLRRGRRRRLLAALVGAVLVSAVFLAYYALNIQSRIAGDAERAASSASESHNPPGKDSGQTTSDGDVAKALDNQANLGGIASERQGHFIFALPSNLRASTLVLSSYMTHPYRGLSMALAEHWTPTFGLGFSEFFRHNISKAFGGDKFEAATESRTYAGKISAKGWPVGQVWATFFIYPASDISFPGVILLLAAIGYFFATSWRDTVTRGDPLAAGVFFSLCTLVFYLPANNQLFQGGETAVGFTVIFVLWLLGRSGALKRWPRFFRGRSQKPDMNSAEATEIPVSAQVGN